MKQIGCTHVLAFKTGKVVSPHRVRKLFDTYMATKIRSPVILKYWMGHSVESSDSEGRYILPPLEEQRKLYAEAYEAIDIRPKRISREDLIAALTDKEIEEATRKMGMTPLQYKTALRVKKAPDKPTETTEKTDESKNVKDCKDGQHCERVCSESELDQLLTEGWKVRAVLSSGRIFRQSGV
jgi:ribosomal protein L12E/L44/L45/RPP1/RPP2